MSTTADPSPRLLGRHDFDARELWQRHPPRLAHAKKRVVLDAAGGLSRQPSGVLSVARYAAGGLPEAFAESVCVARGAETAFEYPAPEAGATTWHLNFADPHLFFAYGAAAFAQDEIQVAEHPILGSLLESLRASPPSGILPLTEESGEPTPLLLRGVERWCAIDTDPDLAMPYGIYGRHFSQASDAALQQAVTRLEVDHRTNLIAMAAPTGSGRYTRADLERILVTAFSGFAAARAETASDHIIIHTGHWGTGAFGGNRVVMALLQRLAAQLARVDELVYHSVGGDGVSAFEDAMRLAPKLETGPVSAALDGIAALGFEWGMSDGN